MPQRFWQWGSRHGASPLTMYTSTQTSHCYVGPSRGCSPAQCWACPPRPGMRASSCRSLPSTRSTQSTSCAATGSIRRQRCGGTTSTWPMGRHFFTTRQGWHLRTDRRRGGRANTPAVFERGALLDTPCDHLDACLLLCVFFCAAIFSPDLNRRKVLLPLDGALPLFHCPLCVVCRPDHLVRRLW